MKSLLIGSTALSAVGLIGIASAQAADKIKLNVGGYFHAFLAASDQSDGAGQPAAGLRNYDIQRKAEIHFKGSTKLDNGVTVGVHVELEAETTGDQIDETRIYFAGQFGKLIIGSEDAAPEMLEMASSEILPSHGLNSPDFRQPSPGSNSIGVPATVVSISSDSEKIIYLERFR